MSSVALSQSFLGFYLSLADPNMAPPQSFPSLRENAWTIHKHILCSQLPSRIPAPKFHAVRCSFPQFVADLDICTLLHCAVTLPLTLTTFNWPQSVYSADHMQSMLTSKCRFSPCLWRIMRMRAHMRQVAVKIWHHLPNVLDTPWTYVRRYVGKDKAETPVISHRTSHLLEKKNA